MYYVAGNENNPPGKYILEYTCTHGVTPLHSSAKSSSIMPLYSRRNPLICLCGTNTLSIKKGSTVSYSLVDVVPRVEFCSVAK